MRAIAFPRISMNVSAKSNYKIGGTMERLDRRISTLTDKVTELENHLGTNDDVLEDAVYDANGNIDQAATRQARLQ
jgi:hypothetical protein